ncbi:GNAT family N-acetyltransferase [Alkalibacillus aidingensis]|uniref:GNAT family N-acetyltransferase n=1 Tax=Alkalibacillus aidingensis TaxID=2747607 RepID=UPI001661333D|nr:GNAT family N-acetyltransferase [Alkalibacillus aidingensis]
MKIREATISDATGIGKVHVDAWITTYKGIVPDEYLDRLTYEKRTRLWESNISKEDQYICVAETNDNEIVGFASGGKRVTNHLDHSGDLTSIYILKEYQGQGIGKGLMKQMFTKFTELGYKTIFVEVLESNESRFFYEGFNAKFYEKTTITIQDKELDLLIYQWKDIDKLLS